MDVGLKITSLLSVLLIAIFCFGCGFTGIDNETIIRTIVEQQFYYKNNDAEKLAESIILGSDAAVTPQYPPYFTGKLCYVSSKKLLYSNIKSDLLYLTIDGYLDYNDLKMISNKMAALQEKTIYNLKKIENTEEYYRKKNYETYMLTITYPDTTELGAKITADIFNDLSNIYGINWYEVRRQEGNLNNDNDKKLFPNLRALSKATKDLDERKKYGDIILKHFVNVLDTPNLPFTSKQLKIFIKDTGKERKDLEIYTMPDRTGSELAYISLFVWQGLKNQWGGDRIGYGSLLNIKRDEIDNLLKYPLNHVIQDNTELRKKIETIFTRFQEGLMRLKEDSEQVTGNNGIPNLQFLEKLLDEKEQIDEKIIPEICSVIQNMSGQEKPLKPPAPASNSTSSLTQQPPAQPAVESAPLNSLNNTEVGMVLSNYYRAISEKRFSDAYSCLTEACRSRQGSLEEFATNRKDTLSVEVLYFEQVAASDKTVTANYKIRTRDKVAGGVQVQIFAGQVAMIKIDDKWLIDNLASRSLKSYLE